MDLFFIIFASAQEVFKKIRPGRDKRLANQWSWNRGWLHRVRRTYSRIVTHEDSIQAPHGPLVIFKKSERPLLNLAVHLGKEDKVLIHKLTTYMAYHCTSDTFRTNIFRFTYCFLKWHGSFILMLWSSG